MGRWSLTAAIVNGVIGSGIFGVPSAVAALTGAWSPLAVLIAGACVFLVILCFAEVGSRFDEAGGPYLYAREAFGPIVGFQVGWLLLVSRLLACAAALNILIVYLGVLAPPVATPTGRALTMSGAMAVATAINVTGVRMAAWTTNVFTIAKLLPLRAAHRAGVAADSGRRARLAGRRTTRLASKRSCCWCSPMADSNRWSLPQASRAIHGETPDLR